MSCPPEGVRPAGDETGAVSPTRFLTSLADDDLEHAVGVPGSLLAPAAQAGPAAAVPVGRGLRRPSRREAPRTLRRRSKPSPPKPPDSPTVSRGAAPWRRPSTRDAGRRPLTNTPSRLSSRPDASLASPAPRRIPVLADPARSRPCANLKRPLCRTRGKSPGAQAGAERILTRSGR